MHNVTRKRTCVSTQNKLWKWRFNIMHECETSFEVFFILCTCSVGQYISTTFISFQYGWHDDHVVFLGLFLQELGGCTIFCFLSEFRPGWFFSGAKCKRHCWNGCHNLIFFASLFQLFTTVTCFNANLGIPNSKKSKKIRILGHW